LRSSYLKADTNNKPMRLNNPGAVNNNQNKNNGKYVRTVVNYKGGVPIKGDTVKSNVDADQDFSYDMFFAVYAVNGTCRIVRQSKFTPRKIMLFFSKLNNRNRGKMLTVTSVLLLALASATPALHAQEWDHINGRDKVHDPTGAWLLRFHIPGDFVQGREFLLIAFHKGGTLTQNTQGESGFDPVAVRLPASDPNFSNNVISSPLSGVWQKTGWNTFAGTLLTIEYHNSLHPLPDVSLFQFTKEQFTGRLTESGDQMVLSEIRLTHFDSDGNQIDETQSFPANGVRIPLEVLPNTGHTLPIPSNPTMPAP
jgi:hypothetical protein